MEVHVRECLLTLEEDSHLRNSFFQPTRENIFKLCNFVVRVVHLCETIELGIVML